MKKSIKLFSLCIILLIATTIPAIAQLATLAWDQNTQPEVIGYKVYYQVDSPTFPFNGTTLLEGTSPITVNGSTTTSLTVDLPNDGNIYYFTATAISDTGLESTYSDIIASEWIPYLLAPTDTAAIGTAVTFAWDLPPTGYNVTYELHYGPDPNFNVAVAPIALPDTFNSGWPQIEMNLVLPLAILLSLLLAIKSGRSKRVWRPVRIGLCVGLFALQVSCGGVGGDTATDPVTTTPDPVVPLTTTVVTGITTTDYPVADLQPDTQYYWKIVAVDDQGYPYESLSQSFTTAAN